MSKKKVLGQKFRFQLYKVGTYAAGGGVGSKETNESEKGGGTTTKNAFDKGIMGRGKVLTSFRVKLYVGHSPSTFVRGSKVAV